MRPASRLRESAAGTGRLLVVLLLAVAATAAAAEPLRLRPGMTGVADLGAVDCATFNHMHPAGPTGMEQALLTWAEGYIYARSGQTLDQVLQSRPAAAWNYERLTAHLVAYCAEHPEAPVPDAVADLWQALNGAGGGS